MPTTVIRLKGNKAQILARLHELGPILAGRKSDPTGLLEDFQIQMGMVLQGKITDAYVTKSEGGQDAMGITWPHLSPVTLALRRKDASAKVAKKLAAAFKDVPEYRKRLIQQNYRKLLEVYRADALGSSAGRRARRYALVLLRLMKPYIGPARHKKLLGELKEQQPDRARRLALAGSFALILRDTGRLLQSFSPGMVSGDAILKGAPGVIEVGTNVAYLKYHQSDKPRRTKKDGSPRLPRRQVLPDAGHPIPASWWADIVGVLAKGIATREFMVNYLGMQAV